MHRSIYVLLATTALAACGGGGEKSGPTNLLPGPLPVASVTVTAEAAQLLPQATSQLSATTKDASGNTLTGRTITWTTSATAIATVSSSGLVTATGVGSAMITATGAGKSATSAIAVADGAVVGSEGGTVVAANGAVKLGVPAGAAPAGTVFVVEKMRQPAPHPADGEPLGTSLLQAPPRGCTVRFFGDGHVALRSGNASRLGDRRRHHNPAVRRQEVEPALEHCGGRRRPDGVRTNNRLQHHCARGELSQACCHHTGPGPGQLAEAVSDPDDHHAQSPACGLHVSVDDDGAEWHAQQPIGQHHSVYRDRREPYSKDVAT